ncbi:MAG: NAD-dependent epimerase/dehydratase family protein [Promethearchaeota archaeon]
MGKILITGATGQIGSNLVRYLISSDPKPLGIRVPSDIVCLVRNLKKAQFLHKMGVTLTQGSLADKEHLKEMLSASKFDYIFHLAANISVYTTYDEMFETNVNGTRNLLEAFVQSNAICFLHASSIIVYDPNQANSPDAEFYEDDQWGPIEPGEDVPYAITKRKAELLVNQYMKKYPEKSFIITRFSAITGRGDRMILPNLVRSLGLKLPKLVDHGKGSLSLTSGLDAARAQVFLAELNHEADHQVFNVANRMVSFAELFSYVADYYHRKPPSFSIPKWLFKAMIPALRIFKFLFPKNITLKTMLSPSALEFLEHTYNYNADKLRNLGFQFQETIGEAVHQGLEKYDPKRLLLKSNIPKKRK